MPDARVLTVFGPTTALPDTEPAGAVLLTTTGKVAAEDIIPDAVAGVPDGWFDVREYGAIGDGASHPLSDDFASLGAAQAVYPHATALTDETDWAGIQAAIDAAMAAAPKAAGRNALGGRVHVGKGHFLCNQPLDCHQSRSLTIQGTGFGIIGASDGGTNVIYTGDGARFIDARSSGALVLRDMAIGYDSPDFRGKLVDLSNGFGPDTACFTLSCLGLFATPNVDIANGDTCHSLVYLNNSITGLIDNCFFQSAAHGIYGHEIGSYSNAIRITNCQFLYCYYALANAGQSWHVTGCTWEGTGGYMRAAYADRGPQTRATVDAEIVFNAATSKITRDTGSWTDDGYKVGQTVCALHTVGAGNNASYGFPAPVIRVTDTDLDFSANTITLAGDTITRDYGDFTEDGWIVGMTPTLSLTACPQNGVQGAITNVTATTLTIAGAAYGASTDYTTGSLYVIYANEFVALTFASEGWTFSDETSTDAYVFVPMVGGPITIAGGWFGDQYLDGAWLQFDHAVGVSLIGNFISTSATNGRVMEVKFTTQGFVCHGNYFQTNIEPLRFSYEVGGGLGYIDGASIRGNNGGTISWLIPDGIDISGFERGGNVGDASEVTVDMDDDDAEITWAGNYYAPVIKVTSTTPFTEDRTLTVPPAPDTGAVQRFVRNTQAGAFSVIVSTGTGSTVSIAQGKGAAIGVDSGGVFRMGADV